MRSTIKVLVVSCSWTVLMVWNRGAKAVLEDFTILEELEWALDGWKRIIYIPCIAIVLIATVQAMEESENVKTIHHFTAMKIQSSSLSSSFLLHLDSASPPVAESRRTPVFHATELRFPRQRFRQWKWCSGSGVQVQRMRQRVYTLRGIDCHRRHHRHRNTVRRSHELYVSMVHWACRHVYWDSSPARCLSPRRV